MTVGRKCDIITELSTRGDTERKKNKKPLKKVLTNRKQRDIITEPLEKQRKVDKDLEN